MKIDLSLYNRILFGDLRPWIESNKTEEKFRRTLTPAFKSLTSDITSFEKALATALKSFPVSQQEDDYIFEIDEDNKKFQSVPDEIFEPLIEIQLPEPPSPKAEFYSILIRLEGTRLINNLNKAIQVLPTHQSKTYTLSKAIAYINSALKDVKQQTKQQAKTQNAKEQTANKFILLSLRNTLIRLQLEINELFENMLPATPYTETRLFEEILKETYPEQSIVQDNVGLIGFRIRHYINAEKFNKQKTLDFIEQAHECYNQYFKNKPENKLSSHRQEVLATHILSLENYYFVNAFSHDKETHGYNTLISDEYMESIFNIAAADVNENLEKHTLPPQRLTAIQKVEQHLSFLQAKIQVDESFYKLSIPRKIHSMIQAAKLFVKANMNVDFSKLTEAKTPPLKTNFSVGDIALLFRMLHELKPAVLDESVKADIFRFIAHNFTTKKSKEGAISTDKLSKFFNNPERKSVEFWQKHIYTLADFLKKI